MNKETLSLKLGSLGVSSKQAEQLCSHLNKSKKFIFPSDPGIESSMSWLKESLDCAIDSKSAQLLYDIVQDNILPFDVEYVEEGYDSCQSHRKISKLVGEAILIGGLIFEGSLLGLKLSLEDSKKYINSLLKIEPSSTSFLIDIAKKYGSKQDFIFPGVTPSSSKTESLYDFAYNALTGKPKTSVRTLTGVGGLRHDKEWNYATDLATFVKLKVDEDKRYYPGIGLFYLLMNLDINSMPKLIELKKADVKKYEEILSFVNSIKTNPKQEYSGVSVLCSSFLPSWNEIKTNQGFETTSFLELADSFHSPSYEFSMLKSIFDQIGKSQISESKLSEQLAKLKKELGYCWSFNSTIHLPWTSELAGLSNDLMGIITNSVGDYCNRYGVGFKQKSIEVREYHFGNDRNFPYGLGGKNAYEAIIYPNSDNFEGDSFSFKLYENHLMWHDISEQGFMKTGLRYLNKL